MSTLPGLLKGATGRHSRAGSQHSLLLKFALYEKFLVKSAQESGLSQFTKL